MPNRLDNFNRAAGSVGTPSDGGSAWQVLGGTWLITEYSSGQFGLVQQSGNYDNAVLDAGSSDASVQVTLQTFYSNVSILLRVVDGSNFVGVTFLDSGSNYIRIFKVAGGSYTPLHDFTGNSVSAGDVVKVGVSGSTYSVYKNGSLIGTWTETSFSTATKYGLSTNETMVFEDFSITVSSGSSSLVVSDGTHAHAADNLALAIIGTLSIADSTHAHAADSITLTAVSNGTITIPAVRDWGTKALKTGQTGVQVDIRSITTGALVVRKTGQTTHATTGVCVVTDAAIVAGTTYEVVTRFADGSRGMWDYTAS